MLRTKIHGIFQNDGTLTWVGYAAWGHKYDVPRERVSTKLGRKLNCTLKVVFMHRPRKNDNIVLLSATCARLWKFFVWCVRAQFFRFPVDISYWCIFCVRLDALWQYVAGLMKPPFRIRNQKASTRNGCGWIFCTFGIWKISFMRQ